MEYKISKGICKKMKLKYYMKIFKGTNMKFRKYIDEAKNLKEQ